MTTKIETVFPPLNKEAREVIENFDKIVQSVQCLSSRQLSQVPEHIRTLSHVLTDNRSERRTGYLNETTALTAYVRYYQWWNLLRLTRLFQGFSSETFKLPSKAVCIDLGSGPLTIPIALWLARPDLRHKQLTWYCVDHSQRALALGEELFLAVVARTNGETDSVCEPWKIIRVRGELGTPIKEPGDFVVCANVFNEVAESYDKPPEFTAKRAVTTMGQYAKATASVLVVEPGTPPSARFLTALRGALSRKNYVCVSPCPVGCRDGEEERENIFHCPMDGSHGSKWCHFVFSTEKAPKALVRLSETASLSKDRASLSFVFAVPKCIYKEKSTEKGTMFIRIASEPIALPKNRVGYYGCSSLGLVLAVSYAEKQKLVLQSGDLIQVDIPVKEKRDYKSGALLIPYEK